MCLRMVFLESSDATRCSTNGRKQATSFSPGGKSFSNPIQERGQSARSRQSCRLRWLHGCARALGPGQLATDGKTLRRSGSPAQGLGPLHLVSVWATQAHLSLGQVAVDAKSNEITAIPRLLQLLDLRGALVTSDAMGCQKEIAQQVVDGGGD